MYMRAHLHVKEGQVRTVLIARRAVRSARGNHWRRGGTVATPAVKRHRTQAERSEHTRELLLDATIDCLVEVGYARTTVHEICLRAGLSRGAQQHHFTTKAE